MMLNPSYLRHVACSYGLQTSSRKIRDLFLIRKLKLPPYRGMTSLQYKPPPPLGNFVHCFWYWEGIPEGAHTHERLMPNGEATIVFNLMDAPIRIYHSDDVRRFDTYGQAILSGARTSYFVIGAAEQERVLGIQFKPGGAFPFFREPADAMENSSIALDDLWRSRADELHERLLAATSIRAMFQILELDLLERLVRPLAWHPAIDYALRHFCRVPHATTVTHDREDWPQSSA